MLKPDADGRLATREVDGLSDEDLARLNRLLPWQCFTLDARGRRFGRPASLIKRHRAQTIPDRRIVELDRRFRLAGLDVLEVGCFEGIHTAALVDLGARVTAVDARIENVIKTLVRLWAFGLTARVARCDVEVRAELEALPVVDVLHHCGVLYHLVDPVTHLRVLLPRVRRGVLLDTHYAEQGEATARYSVAGVEYAYRHYREGGRRSAFAGMYDHAKWLTLETLTALLQVAGFAEVEVAERRAERNGPRALIYAQRAT